MILAGVFNSSSKGRIAKDATNISTTEATAVKVIQFPIVIDKSSRFPAPKYCETMIPAPTEIPTNKTSSKLKIGLDWFVRKFSLIQRVIIGTKMKVV